MKSIQELKVPLSLLVLCVLAVSFGAIAAENKAQRQPEEQPVEVYDFWFGGSSAASSVSVARADLKACEQLKTAKITQQRDLQAGDLAKVLQGTWVRELTWYGRYIPTESALYFDFGPESGTFSALQYDQVSLGTGPMTKRLEGLKNSLEVRSKTPTLTFLDCEFSIVDTYYKISDEIILEGLPPQVKTAADNARGHRLETVWKQLVETAYFERDVVRSMPKRLLAEPGAELIAPSLVGALWQGSLAPKQVGKSKAISFRMNGTYRGSHWASGATVAGHEDATFIREGDKFVSTRLPLAGKDPLAKTSGDTYFKTVAESVTLTWERVVLDPGQFDPEVSASSSASGAKAAAGGSQ